MIHEACMPVYIVILIFLAGGWTIQPEVVQLGARGPKKQRLAYQHGATIDF